MQLTFPGVKVVSGVEHEAIFIFGSKKILAGTDLWTPYQQALNELEGEGGLIRRKHWMERESNPVAMAATDGW